MYDVSANQIEALHKYRSRILLIHVSVIHSFTFLIYELYVILTDIFKFLNYSNKTQVQHC